jgi:erythronate-4-phosphate dehydrogenase
MDIFIDENIPFLAEALQQNEGKEFTFKRFQGRTLRPEALTNCLALCVRSTTLVNETLLHNTPVQFVGTATSGSEHIDIAFLRERGIFFRDARGCNANSVAEYVIFAMLLWAEKCGFMLGARALQGKTLGIVGCGHIGQGVSALAQRLGMRVIAYDPPLVEAGGRLPHGTENMSFSELISKADCITNHVPLTSSGKHTTFGMFDAKVLSHLRPTTLFIHASRGGVVVESALLDALKEKDILAAVDVWDGEPLVNAEIAKLCLLATPHIAGYSYEGKVNGSIMMARELERFMVNIVGKAFRVDWSVFEKALEQETNVRANYHHHGELLRQLRLSRELEHDTASFLASLDTKNTAQAFDTLRKTYPKRREILI